VKTFISVTWPLISATKASICCFVKLLHSNCNNIAARALASATAARSFAHAALRSAIPASNLATDALSCASLSTPVLNACMFVSASETMDIQPTNATSLTYSGMSALGSVKPNLRLYNLRFMMCASSRASSMHSGRTAICEYRFKERRT
jgi:hypothetical protein